MIVIQLSELELHKNALALGFHGCPVNRVNAIMGSTKGRSGRPQRGSRIPSTTRFCGFRPHPAQEPGGCWGGASAPRIPRCFSLSEGDPQIWGKTGVLAPELAAPPA